LRIQQRAEGWRPDTVPELTM